MKRMISILLTLVLIFGTLPVTVFADGNPSASLSVDKTTVKAGEEISVTLNLDTAIPNVMLSEFYIHYDTDLFDRPRTAEDVAVVGDALIGTQVSRKNLLLDGKELKHDGTDTPRQKFSINTFAYPTGFPGTPGPIATITFTAKADITEETVSIFDLEFLMMSDNNFAHILVDTFGNIAVTIQAGTTSEDSAYTVSMPGDTSVIVGETVSIPVNVGHSSNEDATYNAFDMQFSYDSSILELTSTVIEGLTIEPGEGTVRVQGFGDDRNVGEAPFSLLFKAKAAGTAEVILTSAKVDLSDNAVSGDAPDATIIDDRTEITVTGYCVTLPEGFVGAATAVPGEDYTFSEPVDYYDYTVSVTVGGEAVTVTDNGDGSYTIPAASVTGNIVVTATKEGKIFNVTLGEDMTGAATAQYMSNYTATLNKVEGFTYEVGVTVGGEVYAGYSVSEGVYTIPGEDIIGDIVFNVTKTEIPVQEFTVTFEGNGAGDASGEATVEEGSDYTFTVNKVEGYTYTVSATMDGQGVEVVESETHYTIANVTGNLVITVEKEADLIVEVNSYVELDAKTVFLVTATGTLGEGEAYAYDGNAMFYSEVYEAWCYLTIEEGEFNADAAKEKIAATQTSFITLSATNDVNMSGLVDINDAQLVYDIYNGKYQDFTVVVMQKFLHADVNADKIVNVTDAAAVVAAIQ